MTLGLLFSKDAIGHLNRLTLALQSGMLGGMPVAPKYDSAGKKNPRAGKGAFGKQCQ